MSMNPGSDHEPVALERAPRGLVDGPTATMRSPRTPTSARNHGLPAPSMTRPPRKQRSSTVRSPRRGSRRAARRPCAQARPAARRRREHHAGDEGRLVGGEEAAPPRPPRPACRCGRADTSARRAPARRARARRRSSQAAVRIGAGRDGVHAHAVAAVAGGDRRASAIDARLRRAVGLVADVGLAVHRGDRDDRRRRRARSSPAARRARR